MSGNKVVNKQVVVNKRVDINIFAAQFGVLEIQALIQKGFVVDSTQPIRKRGNHIFVELIGTEDAKPEQVVIIDDVLIDDVAEVEAPEEEVAKPTVVVKETIVKPAAKKTTKAKEVKDA